MTPSRAHPCISGRGEAADHGSKANCCASSLLNLRLLASRGQTGIVLHLELPTSHVHIGVFKGRWGWAEKEVSTLGATALKGRQ